MKFNLFSLVIFGILRLSRCQNQFILGFNKKSCDTLEPMYVLEDYTHIKLGPNNEEKSGEELKEPIRSPTRYNTRNPPVEIKIDFDQYRRNREYKIRLEASRFFDGYMLQVQGKRDGNRTYVGSWKSAKNKVPRLISCNGIKNAGLISKKRPVQYGNQTFYWRAPSSDAGPLRIFVSIIFQDAYFILNSKEITFNAYPLSLKGCGKSMSCFRYCKMEPFCDADETEYMLTISEDPKNPESVMFKLGGKVNGPENYIALGFGYDMTNIKDMDIVACYNENNAIKLGHYLLENQDSNPQIHRSKIQLELSDYDEETGYIWCQFSRPINPQSVFDINFASKLFRFYFWGERNATEILLPPMNQVFSSPLSLNISDQVNEVRFNGGKSSGQTLLNPEFLLYFVTIFLSFIGI